MASDAHAHPGDLALRFPAAEEERRRLGIACAASAWNGEEFTRHEAMAAAAEADGAAPFFLCFAVHPQLPASSGKSVFSQELDLLAGLAEAGKLSAVGETGFDRYNAAFQETASVQEELFAAHLEIARRYGLPLVLHVRRSMDNIFRYTRELQHVPAAVFHSWPGVPDEGLALLRRGVNAFFSFGTPLLLNHKNALRSCAAFPASRLLVETDAPYQPLRGAAFSRWADIPAVIKAAADIRNQAGAEGGSPEELERITDRNFFTVFGPQCNNPQQRETVRTVL